MEHSITLKDRSSLHISGIEHIYKERKPQESFIKRLFK